MSEFSLLILCSGFGKRMASLTKNIPKPLLKVKNTTLLANNINFFKNLGCNNFFINTHYLHKNIELYINQNFKNYPINLFHEPIILGTGGGIKNIFNYTNDKNICVVNSDIFWQDKNKLDIKKFIFDLNKVTHCKILLSKKNNFFGLKNKKGDFYIKKDYVSKWIEGNEVMYYSGFQIVSRKIFNKTPKIFPMNEIWNDLILKKKLKAEIMNSNIKHIGDKNSFDMF